MNFWLMLPELVVIATAFAAGGADLLVADRSRRALAAIALGGIAAAFTAALAAPLGGALFGGRFIVDGAARWFKLLFLLAGFLLSLIHI